MLFRIAVVVAVCALIAIASGAVVTSSREAITGENTTRVETPFGAETHQVIGVTLCGLILVEAVWLWMSRHGFLSTLALASVALAAADSWVAFRRPPEPSFVVLHAWLAPVFFTSLVAIALFASPRWTDEPELVDDRGLRFLRPLAVAGPPLVLVQIVLGAMYRHKLASVMWHMAGAMIVSLATLIASMIVLQQYPTHRALRSAAIALMSAVLTQIAFGVAAFTMQLLETESALALGIATVSHVVIGNLTLAASLIFALQAQRSVRSRMA